MVRPIARATLLAFALVFLSVSASLGHAELRSASPGPGEVLDVPPTALVARFTQDLRQDRTSIEVRDAAGETIARGGRDRDRRRVQRIDLPPLEPGDYEVRWVTWSAEDDELARGRYRFTVTEGAAPTSEAAVSSPCPSPLAPSVSPDSSPSVAGAVVSPVPPVADEAAEASAHPVPTATPDPCATDSSAVVPAEGTPSAPPSPSASPEA
jgi:methionine-rich copper-binding protein CopC